MTKDNNKKAPKFVSLTTPPGIAKYPKLNVPDTKFDAKGIYSVKVRLDAHDATNLAFIGKLEEHQKAAIEEAGPIWEEMKKNDKKKKLKGDVVEHVPYWRDEETDEYEINFKMNSSYTDKKTGKDKPLKPALFDAKLKKLTKEVTGGSLVKVAFDIVPYCQATGAGISLRLKAVQVLELKAWGANPDQLGFGVEDDYEGVDEDPEDTNGFTSEVDETEDTSGGDF